MLFNIICRLSGGSCIFHLVTSHTFYSYTSLIMYDLYLDSLGISLPALCDLFHVGCRDLKSMSFPSVKGEQSWIIYNIINYFWTSRKAKVTRQPSKQSLWGTVPLRRNGALDFTFVKVEDNAVWFKRQSNYFANKTMSLSPRPTKTTNKQKTKTK
jgi:hypothetical protein